MASKALDLMILLILNLIQEETPENPTTIPDTQPVQQDLTNRKGRNKKKTHNKQNH